MHDEAALARFARLLPDAARAVGLRDDDTLATLTDALARRDDVAVRFERGEVRPECLAALPPLPEHVASAVVLATAREALLVPSSRRRHGAHYTPYPVARRLAAIALDAHEPATVAAVCDPAVGGGIFLVALADELCARGMDRARAIQLLWGADIDPLSSAVARTALRLSAGGPVAELDARVVHGDSLVHGHVIWDRAPDGFDLVIGNPPFLNQLQRASARTRVESAHLAARFGDAVRGYVDASALFLLASLDLAASLGVVLLIQPQSCLTARDAARVRETIDRHARLEGLWFCRERVFEANVRVCAPMVRVAPPAEARSVARWVDREVTATSPIERDDAPGDWSRLVTDLLDVPTVTVEPARTLRDIGCGATSGFRDQFYGFVDATHERDERPDAALRLVTVGMIEPLGLAWGRRRARFARRDFLAPVVEYGDLDAKIAAWADARRGAKLLVATQTKVIEAALDERGDCVPLTPVIEVRPAEQSLWLVAAVLTNPVTTAIACRLGAGSALAIDAIKLSARQVLELPVPADAEQWQRGAELARRIARGHGDRTGLWRALAETMCHAYGQPIEPLCGWWLDRLPKVALTAPVAPC